MDHWGLIDELPDSWPLWSGEKSAALMRLTLAIFGKTMPREISTWHSRQGTMDIGGFRITPILTDHSALDAYMLVVERDGVRILYTGDFRTHGRKGSLVEAMIDNPPADIDVLLMEGTNLRSDKPVITEAELEERFVTLALETPRHVFVDWSAQNFDRTVTLYRAALRTGRKFVVDLYAAEAMRLVADGTRLPRPSAEQFDALQVVITPLMLRQLARLGREGLVDELKAMGRATSRRALRRERAIIMGRSSLIRDFERERGGLRMTDRDAFLHSSWSGYLDEDDEESGWATARRVGARREMIHTSGHASASELSRLANAISPRALVPVHGVEWDDPQIDLPPVVRLADGHVWTIPAR